MLRFYQCCSVLILLITGCFHQPHRLKKIYSACGNGEDNWTVVPTIHVPFEDDYCRMQRRSDREEAPAATIENKLGPNQPDGSVSLLYQLGVVEVDDQGQFWSKQQVETVLQSLRDQINQRAAGAIVAVYVHGWNNNAAVCDSKLRGFRRLLEQFALNEQALAEQRSIPPRTVAGIYLGWRGQSGRRTNYLTFGQRKRGAHRVGEGAGITLLNRLAAMDVSLKKAYPNSKMVFIGHSLGAAVLISAVHARVGTILSDMRQHGNLSLREMAFGDFVLFLNPAFEALRFQQIYALSQELGESYQQMPRIVSLSSAKDKVTRIPFTLAMRLWYKKGAFRDDAEKDAYLTAFGNYKKYHTHTFYRSDLAHCDAKAQKMLIELAFGRDPDEDQAAKEEIQTLLAEDATQCLPDPVVQDYRQPYLSIYDADGALINGHNGEMKPRVFRFIHQLLELFKVLDPPEPPDSIQ